MPLNVNPMWFEGKLPVFRRHPLIGGLVCAGLVIAAICVKLLVPSFPTLTILFPAAQWGLPTLLVCGLVGYYFLGKPLPVQTASWQSTNVIIFLLVGGLIIFVVDLLGKAVDRYQHERRRLDLALRAAKAALWESHPKRPLYCNKNFYDLIGLQHTDHAPPAEQFFELVHPEDREKMREARHLMDSGFETAAHEAYEEAGIRGQITAQCIEH